MVGEDINAADVAVVAAVDDAAAAADPPLLPPPPMPRRGHVDVALEALETLALDDMMGGEDDSEVEDEAKLRFRVAERVVVEAW